MERIGVLDKRFQISTAVPFAREVKSYKQWSMDTQTLMKNRNVLKGVTVKAVRSEETWRKIEGTASLFMGFCSTYKAVPQVRDVGIRSWLRLIPTLPAGLALVPIHC